MTVSKKAPFASSVPVPTAPVRNTRSASKHIQKQQEGMIPGPASHHIDACKLNPTEGMKSVPENDLQVARAVNGAENQKGDASVRKEQR